MLLQKAITNLDTINKNIESARLQVNHHHIVHLVGVSKYQTPDTIRMLYEAGQRAFGENKVQDLIAKQAVLDDLPLEWHFIGKLQTNKINALIDARPALFHSLDSYELALELDKRLKIKGSIMRALLQINSAEEKTKNGVAPKDAIAIYEKIYHTCANIKLVGVMTIGAHTEDENIIAASFNITRDIFNQLATYNPTICSMGMSHDYELAIRSQSTMIRVGSLLFQN